MKRHQRRLLIAVPIAVVLLVLIIGSLPDGPLVITPPPVDAEPGRWKHLEGAANTRDAGGYPTVDGQFVRRHQIYRSGKLNRLSSAGADAYRDLGVTSVIDFTNRLTPWPLFGGDVWSVHFASAVHGCPISFSKEGEYDHFYINGVADNREAYREAFALLAEPENYPVLYHCAIGVDRTGVMSALLLRLLGVPRDVIIADFRLSEQVELPGRLPAMEALLDHVEAQGGIEAYLEGIGVTPDQQQRIRAHLLTAPPADSTPPAQAVTTPANPARSADR